MPAATHQSPSRAALLLTVLAFAVPVSLNLWLIWSYAVNAPVHDDWWLAYKFTQFDAGFTLNEVLGQANESRPAVPAVVLFGLAQLTGWDVRFQMLAAQVLVAGTSLGLLYFTRSTLRLGWAASLAVGALSAALLHSPVQYQSLLWGIQVILYVPAACLVGCLLIAQRPWSIWAKTALYLVACAIATYSYANGMTLFAIVPWLTILDARQAPTRHRVVLALLWTATAAICIGRYFSDYQSPAAVPSMSAVAGHLVDAAHAFLLYLGAPLAIGSRPAVMAAVVGVGELLLLGMCALRLLMTPQRAALALQAVPWILLTGYGVLAGVLIVIGRLGFGVEYALAPRYVAFSVFVLIGTIHLVALTTGVTATVGRRVWLTGLASIVAVLHVLAVAAVLPRYPALRTERRQSQAATWLIPQLPYAMLGTKVSAFMSDAMALPLAASIDARGWLASGLLRAWPDSMASPPLTPGAGGFESGVDAASGAVTFSGWCAIANPSEPCHAVLVTERTAPGTERACTVFFPAEPRPEQAASLHLPADSGLGWSGIARCTANADLRVWSIDSGRRSLALIGSVGRP